MKFKPNRLDHENALKACSVIKSFPEKSKAQLREISDLNQVAGAYACNEICYLDRSCFEKIINKYMPAHAT